SEVLELAQAPKTPPEQSLRLIEWALQTHPASVPALLARADLFLQAGDTDAALLLYRRALERPSGAEVLTPEKLLAKAKRHPAPLELLRVSVELHPGSAPLWQALAAREQEAGDAEAAQSALEHVKGLATPVASEPAPAAP
ncbi:MAG TPA: serine hydrolase, partial [Myxococcaceae bacterium]